MKSKNITKIATIIVIVACFIAVALFNGCEKNKCDINTPTGPSISLDGTMNPDSDEKATGIDGLLSDSTVDVIPPSTNEELNDTVIEGCEGTAIETAEITNTTANMPEMTEAETTAEPEEIIVPETTIIPEITAIPETTVAPEATITPEITVIPETIKEPETTKVPESTYEPEETTEKEDASTYETMVPEETTEPPHTCSFGLWTTFSSNICTEEKIRTRICECGAVETEKKPATSHSYTYGICTSCKFAEKNDPKHTHQFGGWIISQSPTCTKTGIRTRVCSCTKSETESIPTTGHKEIAVNGTPATCIKDGLTDGTKCSKCNVFFIEQKAIPATGHNLVYGICTLCGLDVVKIAPELSAIDKVLIAPTESDFGDMWSKADKLYRAILSGTGVYNMEFKALTSVEAETKRAEFIELFNEKVLCGLPIWQYVEFSGSHTEIFTDVKATYDEFNRLNEYRNTILNIGIKDGMDKLDAVRIINDYICATVEYEWYANTAYDAFVNRKANCEGYALFFIALCNRAGIDADYVEGRTRQNDGYGFHAWNIVYVGGKLYYNDACWNDTGKNAYFMSETLWDDHSDDLDVNVSISTNITTETVVLSNIPQTVVEMLTEPTAEGFGSYYAYATALYNAIVSGAEEVEIVFDCKNEEFYPAVAYSNFEKLFCKLVLDENISFKYTATWNADGNKVGRVAIDVSYITALMSEKLSYIKATRNFNLNAGICEGQNVAEAISCIINYMCDELTYKVNNYITNPGRAISEGIADDRLYAYIFTALCEDVGIKAEVKKGTVNNTTTTIYFNSVLVNDKEYYTNAWYYFTVTHKGYENCAYGFSDTLWTNHTLG